jgi:hypothetical protein
MGADLIGHMQERTLHFLCGQTLCCSNLRELEVETSYTNEVSKAVALLAVLRSL